MAYLLSEIEVDFSLATAYKFIHWQVNFSRRYIQIFIHKMIVYYH